MSEPKAIVFVVDDDESVRESLGSLIRSAGLRVETFASAQEFLAGARSKTVGAVGAPSCLALDLHFPGLSGPDLQKRMAELNIEIPIIFITGRGDIPTTVRAINSVKSGYLTTVYDAVSRTINEKLAPLNGRKAIVIFSDGVDTWSQHASYDSTLDLATRSGALIYAVQYNTSNIGGSPTAPYLLPRRYFTAPSVFGQQDSMRAEFERHRIASNFLRAIAERSGARHLQAASIENSERAFALIADELRHQYLLEYYSTNDQRDGGYRSITVRLKRDELVVRARKGYRAPKAENRGGANQETKPPGQSKP